MAMHNYIKKHALKHLEFDKCDAYPFYMPQVEEDEDIGGISKYGQPDHDGLIDENCMLSVHHKIATSLMNDRR